MKAKATVGTNNPSLVQELDSIVPLVGQKKIIARFVIRVCQNISEM